MEGQSPLSSIARMIQELSTTNRRFPKAPRLAGSPSSSSGVLRPQEDLQRLRKMLPRVRAFVELAEEREVLDEGAWLWLRELRGVAYDADDILDELEYRLLRADAGAAAQRHTPTARPGKRQLLHAQFSDALLQIDDARFWDELTPKIEKIRKRFEDTHEAHLLRAQFGNRRHLGTAPMRMPSSCFVETPCFYGREEEKKTIIDGFLLSDQCLARNLSVIAIDGMGGVGKTTLVQHVYNDQAVSEHFEMKGWVCVSDDFDLVALTRRILEALTKKSHDLCEFSTLQEAVRREIEGKRFLLVLDDLWNERGDPWERLLSPLRFGAQGSAIVTTTRNALTAFVVGTAHSLSLRCLSSEECWKIFQQYAFDGRDPRCNQDLVDIGRKIVGKCKGLPLAVKALGGLLRSKPDAQSWEDILQSELWDIDGQGDEVLSALKLSYLHLKTNLKQCFVYCSIFPKDHRFTKSQLVYMWVAQGFIQHGSGRQVEDIGSDYFEELLQRSFFQYCQGEQSSPYVVEHEETCVVMHDLIHDLAQFISMGECLRIEHHRPKSHPTRKAFHFAQSITRGEELGRVWCLPLLVEACHSEHALSSRGECFGIEVGKSQSLSFLELRHFAQYEGLREVEMPKAHSFDFALSISTAECLRVERGRSQSLPTTKARHLSLVGLIPFGKIVVAPATLRTFMMLKVFSIPKGKSRHLNNLVTNLHCLRVLDLSHLPIRVLPDATENLIHLRYLNLSYTQIEKLPISICKLYHMQTLLLTGCQMLRGLPKGTKNLTNLRNLPVFYVGRHGEECGLEELKDLVNLRGSLKIYGLSCVSNVNDAKMANLRDKTSLRELKLSWVNVSGDRLAYLGRKTSPSFQGNAEEFVHSGSRGAPGYGQSEVLENLQPPTSLRVLEIYQYDGSHFPSWMGSRSLNKLVKVELYCCSYCAILPKLGQLPYLKHLHIRDSWLVEDIGSEFRGDVEVGFPSLEELVLEHMHQWKRWHAVERGDFPCLRRLEIRHCNNLRGTLPVSYPLPMLKELVLQHCDSLDSVHLCSLPSLELLHIDHCQLLRTIKFPNPSPPLSSMTPQVELPPLKHLGIAGCPIAHFLPEQCGDVPLLRTL